MNVGRDTEVLGWMDAKAKGSRSLGRRECGRLTGSLLVLVHGTTPTREDVAGL